MTVVPPTRPARRPAFTLIELLIVILIIAVLASLTAFGVFRWIGSQQSRNTKSAMQSVDKVLMAHWSHVIGEASKETPSDVIKLLAASQDGSKDPSGERAKALWIKTRLLEAFPQAYGEVTDSANPVAVFLASAIPANRRKYTATYRSALGKGTLKAAKDPDTESAACLLMALTIARGGAPLPQESLGPFIDDTDTDGVKELIDGWRKPVAFYRFAWSPGPGSVPDVWQQSPAAKMADSKEKRFADPVDRGGTLLNGGWYVAPLSGPTKCGPTFETVFHKIYYPPSPAPPPANPVAQYAIPVIASAGDDGLLGLVPPSGVIANGFTATSAPDAEDNLYSYLLR